MDGTKESRRRWVARVPGCSERGRAVEVVGSGKLGDGRNEGERAGDGECVLVGPLLSRSPTDLLDLSDSERDRDLDREKGQRSSQRMIQSARASDLS